MPAAAKLKSKSKSATKKFPERRSCHLPSKRDIIRKFADFPPLRADGSRLLSKQETMANVNLTFPTMIDRMRRGEFPIAREVCGRPMWLESEIHAWIASLPRRHYASKERE